MMEAVRFCWYDLLNRWAQQHKILIPMLSKVKVPPFALIRLCQYKCDAIPDES